MLHTKGFKNGGGAAIFCGKGVLGTDIVHALRAQRVDKYLNVHLISPLIGETRVAFMQGMKPELLTSTISKMHIGESRGGSGAFFYNAAVDLLFNACILLDAAVELEKYELEQRAVSAGYPSYTDWRKAIDVNVSEMTRDDGTPLGLESLDELNEWLIQNGLSPQQENAMRHFFWKWSQVTNMALSWLDDALYMIGAPAPLTSAAAGAPPAPTVKVVQAMPAPSLAKPFVEWILTHPSVLVAGSQRGELIRSACQFVANWLAQNEQTRSNVQSTLRNWLVPLLNSRELRLWADIEGDAAETDENGVSWIDEYIEDAASTGAQRTGTWYRSKVLDLEAILHGAIVGFALPVDKYGIAGDTITQLCKARIYSAIKRRPTNWRDDVSATSVMLMIDEAHLVMKGDPNNLPDEVEMASIGRSLGLALMIATQGRALLDGMFGTASVDGMLNNFSTQISYKCDDGNTLSHMNSILGTHQVYKYNFYLPAIYRNTVSSNYVTMRDEGRTEFQADGDLARLHAQLRFTESRPAGVILDDKAKDALLDQNDRTGAMVRSIGQIAWLFTGGLVTNIVEPFKGTAKLLKYAVRAANEVLHGRSRDLDGYVPPPFEFINPNQNLQQNNGIPVGASEVELFPPKNWPLLDQRFHAVGRIMRAGAPRRAIFKTIGHLNRDQLEAIAAKQPGIETIYTYIERQEKLKATQAIDLSKAA